MSKQSKGKTSSQTRIDNANLVRGLVAFLRKVVNNPTPYFKNQDLIDQLKSQGGLETLNTKDFKIGKLALGTIKSCAKDPRESVIDGGWPSIEILPLPVNL